MKKLFLPVLLFLSAFMVQAADVPIRINPADRRQTIEGWGVSLCWWANMCGKWDQPKVDFLTDLLTSPDKLNMNIFRYNIGGGDDPSHTDGNNGHMCKGKGKRAEMEGFKASADADYNWCADSAQRRIMLQLKAKRSDVVFEAFSNSPPYWMTYSGCASGNQNANQDNLKPEYYDQFCDYLIEVCKHYKDVYGIEFKTLDPFNEPVTNYWGYLGGQEGCHFEPASQISLIRRLYPKLQATGLSTVISASDETSISTSHSVLSQYIKANNLMPMIGQWNTHSYSGNNKDRSNLRDLVNSTKLPFWMSETGSGGSGLNGNLSLAERMFSDLNVMKPQAWIDWQFVEEGNDQWCMVQGDFASQWYKVVKNCYVRMQVTRFIKQGYTLLESPDEHILAALNPEGTELVIVALNNTDEETRFVMDLSLFSSLGSQAIRYLTNDSRNCEKLSSIYTTADKQLPCLLPKRSIATYILPVTAGEGISGIHPERRYLFMPRMAGTTAKATDAGVSLSAIDLNDTLQHWRIAPLTNGTYQFYTISDGNKLAMTDNGGYALALTPLNPASTNQQFTIDSIGDGCLKILSKSTGKSLDLDNEKTDPGTNLGLWAYATNYTNGHRQWRLLTVPFLPDPILSDISQIKIPSSHSLYAENGILYIQSNSSVQKEVHILLPSGSPVKSFETAEENLSQPLPNGLYIVQITTPSGTENHKIYVP